MKHLAIAALLLAPAAYADSVTTADLKFSCQDCNVGKPTNGSFVYDNTTNQFLSMSLDWNGMLFNTFFLTNTSAQTDYNQLIGEGLFFTFSCTGVDFLTEGPCDSTEYAFFGSLAQPYEIFLGSKALTPLNFNAFDDGIVRATHLKDPVVNTPEPPTWVLMASGLTVLGLAGVLIGRIFHRVTRPAPPVIMTKYGAVTEKARKKAALDMREDPDLMERVTRVVASELTPAELQHATELCNIIAPLVLRTTTLSDDGMIDLLYQVQKFLQNYVDVSMVAVRDRAMVEMQRRYPEAF